MPDVRKNAVKGRRVTIRAGPRITIRDDEPRLDGPGRLQTSLLSALLLN
jgi:hypothetical protein